MLNDIFLILMKILNLCKTDNDNLIFVHFNNVEKFINNLFVIIVFDKHNTDFNVT